MISYCPKKMQSHHRKTKITLKLKEPNPLFTKWITEWMEYAKEHNLRTRNVFNNALESIKKYPLPLNSGQDCIILQGFGPTICNMLDKKLKSHQTPEVRRISPPREIIQTKENLSPKKKTTTTKVAIKRKQKEKKIQNKDEENKVDDDESESVMMPANSFETILLVDVQETSGKHKRNIDATLNGLTEQKIKFEVRRLHIGDFTWICRNKEGAEIILPYIVERKRIDDFGHSIKDGRFHEQKFRLQQSGVKNLIYLIESYGNNTRTVLPISTLLQAATNTQVQGNFSVKFTDSHDDSILYLSVMTELLTNKYKDKVLISCTRDDVVTVQSTDNFIAVMKFNEFNKLAAKTRNYKAREIFVKQLLQLKMLSVDKVLAITKIYSTPQLLISAYKNCSTAEEAVQLIADIKYGPLNMPIGQIISKILYQFYIEYSPDS